MGLAIAAGEDLCLSPSANVYPSIRNEEQDAMAFGFTWKIPSGWKDRGIHTTKMTCDDIHRHLLDRVRLIDYTHMHTAEPNTPSH